MGESIYNRLGVRRVILGKGWYTQFGGSIMPKEVAQAMADAAPYHVDIPDLHRKAGAVIAGITGAEAALVTAGASAGLVLMAAACMTGTDMARLERLPDSSGMKNEILMQKCQRNRYDSAFRLAGARVVEVGTATTTGAEELEAGITDKTAAVAWLSPASRSSPLPFDRILRIAHGRGVPVIVDAAQALPPEENLRSFITAGADLVVFSGGKGLRGPQSSGILCGRKDLIQSATLNSMRYEAPSDALGRPMKVCKEEIVGLLAALDYFQRLDHRAERQAWNRQSRTILDSLQGIPGVRACIEDDDTDHAAGVAVAYFEPSWQGRSAAEIAAALQRGDPPIEIRHGAPKEALWVVPVCLRPGDEVIVARRLREELTGH